MIIAIPKETLVEETRVAAVPDLVAKYVQAGLSVQVESGAGNSAHFLDDAYANAGATIVADRSTFAERQL